MAKQMIGDLKENDRVRSYFLVREKILSTTRKGKFYLSVDLVDRSGSISGKMWDDAEEAYARFEKGEPVAVLGTVDRYQGVLQMKMTDIRATDERDEKRLDMAELIPHTPSDIDEMWGRLLEAVGGVGDEDIRGLLEAIFNDGDMAAAFRRSTAARDMHHNYIGGLLEHTMSVTEIASFLCDHYGAEIDRDLVVAGALLHDIGKTREIDSSADLNYTIEGSLKGHTMIGLEIVKDFERRIEGFPRAKMLLIEHLIISHQGQKEWSSPVEPKIPEAQVLHMADLTDARMFQMLRAIRDDRNEDDPFTSKVYALGRSILKIRDAGELGKLLPEEG